MTDTHLPRTRLLVVGAETRARAGSASAHLRAALRADSEATVGRSVISGARHTLVCSLPQDGRRDVLARLVPRADLLILVVDKPVELAERALLSLARAGGCTLAAILVDKPALEPVARAALTQAGFEGDSAILLTGEGDALLDAIDRTVPEPSTAVALAGTAWSLPELRTTFDANDHRIAPMQVRGTVLSGTCRRGTEIAVLIQGGWLRTFVMDVVGDVARTGDAAVLVVGAPASVVAAVPAPPNPRAPVPDPPRPVDVLVARRPIPLTRAVRLENIVGDASPGAVDVYAASVVRTRSTLQASRWLELSQPAPLQKGDVVAWWREGNGEVARGRVLEVQPL